MAEEEIQLANTAGCYGSQSWFIDGAQQPAPDIRARLPARPDPGAVVHSNALQVLQSQVRNDTGARRRKSQHGARRIAIRAHQTPGKHECHVCELERLRTWKTLCARFDRLRAPSHAGPALQVLK